MTWDYTQSETLEALVDLHTDIANSESSADTQLLAAWSDIALVEDGAIKDALKHLAYAGWSLQTALHQMAQYWDGDYPYYPIPIYLYHFTNPVTYKTIVEAWGANDFEGRVWTIAFIDRMRQLLWDEPFSVLWAARPEEQDI